MIVGKSRYRDLGSKKDAQQCSFFFFRCFLTCQVAIEMTVLTHAAEEWEMVRNGSAPHDVLRQLVQEGGMLGRGEADLQKETRFPNLSVISNTKQCKLKRRSSKQVCVDAVLKT